jgi:hypothetical protein
MTNDVITSLNILVVLIEDEELEETLLDMNVS